MIIILSASRMPGGKMMSPAQRSFIIEAVNRKGWVLQPSWWGLVREDLSEEVIPELSVEQEASGQKGKSNSSRECAISERAKRLWSTQTNMVRLIHREGSEAPRGSQKQSRGDWQGLDSLTGFWLTHSFPQVFFEHWVYALDLVTQWYTQQSKIPDLMELTFQCRTWAKTCKLINKWQD